MHGRSRRDGVPFVSWSPRLNGHDHSRAGATRRGAEMECPSPCEAHINLRLPAEAESVAAAHHSVFGLATALGPVALDDVRLLISELVTNAIRHADLGPNDWIELEVDMVRNRIRVEVRDPGPGFDPTTVAASKPTDGPGWGLRFLRQIASRWGVDRDGGTSVWFELDLRPPTSPRRFTPRGHG